MHFSWKRFHILQNTIDFVTKVGLWLRLHISLSPILKLWCVCDSSGVQYQPCVAWLIVGATTAAGKTHWALKLMCICNSMSPFWQPSTSREKFACGGLFFPTRNGESIFLDGAMSCNSVWPYIVIEVAICTPVRKSLYPPLIPVIVIRSNANKFILTVLA